MLRNLVFIFYDFSNGKKLHIRSNVMHYSDDSAPYTQSFVMITISDENIFDDVRIVEVPIYLCTEYIHNHVSFPGGQVAGTRVSFQLTHISCDIGIDVNGVFSSYRTSLIYVWYPCFIIYTFMNDIYNISIAS
jgi:hypothetical protein